MSEGIDFRWTYAIFGAQCPPPGGGGGGGGRLGDVTSNFMSLAIGCFCFGGVVAGSVLNLRNLENV